MKLKITLEGNSYIIYDEDENELESYDRSQYGDQIAKLLADTFCRGFNVGYDAATPISSENQDE